MTKKRAFTLIESLAVISIIGILATLVLYAITSYQRTGRDAKRKSDLFAISQGFEARALDQTCTSPSDIGKYPNVTISPKATTKWLPVSGVTLDPSCNGFGSYLTSIPSDPQTGYDYYFNLNPTFGSLAAATHYRLSASLENNNKTSCSNDTTESGRWRATYNGVQYDCPTLDGAIHAQFGGTVRQYDYYIGK